MSKDLFDYEKLYRDSIVMMEGLSPEELQEWYHHPCTQALILSLRGDMLVAVSGWMDGAYADSTSSDATAQLQAMARGKGQAASEMLGKLENIAKGELDEE